MTGLPRSLIRRIEALRVDKEEAEAFDGKATWVDVYEVDIEIFGVCVKGARVAAVSSETGFLGRDFLNEYHICLNGPAETTTLGQG